MHTSARNQFEGTVARIVEGAINDEIVVALKGGQEIVATITKASTRRLGLAQGKPVIALVKASFVILFDETEDLILSTRNVYRGTVTDVARGQVMVDVTMAMEGGLAMTSTITVPSCEKLHLVKGASVTAAVKASAVVLAVRK